MKILGSGALSAQEKLEGVKNSGWISSKLMNILTFTVVCKYPFLRRKAAQTGDYRFGTRQYKCRPFLLQARVIRSLKYIH
jgi:uncharacterized membrane protein